MEGALESVNPLVRRRAPVWGSLQGPLEQVDEGGQRNPVEVVQLRHVADREVEV